MYDLIMLSIYLCITAYLAYLLIVVFIRGEPRIPVEKLSTTRLGIAIRVMASRITFIFKILKLILLKPIILLPMIALVLFMLISAESVIPTYSWYKVSDESFNGLVIVTSFNTPLSIKEYEEFSEHILSDILNISKNLVKLTLPIAKITLSNPITLDDINRSIYVIVAIPNNYLAKIKEKLGLELNTSYIVSCNNELRSGCVQSSELLSLTIINHIYLLPIQGYIGLKPIFPPPESVVITSLNMLPAILGEEFRDKVITDLIMISNLSLTNTEFLESVRNSLSKGLSTYHIVSSVELMDSTGKYVFSRTPIPTPKSVLVATITSVISVIVLLAVLQALTPEIKSLYEKLLLIGMPHWSMTIISSLYISSWMFLIGVPTLILIYLRYGGLSTFNSFITLSITWISSLIYVNKSLKPISLTKSDVYIPVTRRYDLILSNNGVKLDKLESIIKDSLGTNEFFTLEELESQYYGNELVIHARLMYNEVWGSGLDMNIIISKDKDGIKIHISSYIWGIEEVSESVLNTMLSLAISRIVGAIKSCLIQY